MLHHACVCACGGGGPCLRSSTTLINGNVRAYVRECGGGGGKEAEKRFECNFFFRGVHVRRVMTVIRRLLRKSKGAVRILN